jgi:hypothetical protein
MGEKLVNCRCNLRFYFFHFKMYLAEQWLFKFDEVITAGSAIIRHIDSQVGLERFWPAVPTFSKVSSFKRNNFVLWKMKHVRMPCADDTRDLWLNGLSLCNIKCSCSSITRTKGSFDMWWWEWTMATYICNYATCNPN